MPTLALIHTSATLVPVFAQLCKDKIPHVATFNIVDDSLVRAIGAKGALTADIARRVGAYITSAEMGGADHILVTCSSIGPAVEASALFCRVPVLRVDQPMADRAVALGSRIGIVATLPTTLHPTTDLLQRRAALAGKQVQLDPVLCTGAFEALMAGDSATHDRIVTDALLALVQRVDVVVLAQASIARVVAALPASAQQIPLLASPGLAIDHLAGLLAR